MEGEYRDGKRLCYFHPNEVVIGVCSLCLHQRLLVLQQIQHHQHISTFSSCSSSSISLHKVFALLNRLHIARSQRRKSNHHSAASISQQDSFISINLEDNSITSSSWDKKAIVPKVSSEECKKKDSAECGGGLKTLVEQTKPRSSDLRWRKRIGHWFQLVRWKRSTSSSKGHGCHVGSKVKVKVIKHACMDR